MLVRVLVLAPFLPLLIALALIMFRIVPRLLRSVPTAMFTILVTVEIDVIFLATLVLPSDKLLD